MTAIEVHRGDITKLAVAAIVNAANRAMLGGGGVDGAIHLEEEDKAIVTWMKAATADDRLRIEDPVMTGELLHRLTWGALFWPALFEGPLSDEDPRTTRRELLEMFLGRYRA